MKKFLSILLVFIVIVISCLQTNAINVKADESQETVQPEFSSLSDPELRAYLEDEIYLELVEKLDSDEYFVENISCVYISQEYLEEVAYNSKANIYFGYNLEDLENAFQGTKYVFCLGEDGETTVKAFEEYDDTFDQILRNVAIGTGVILICVTVSVVTAGTGAAAISMIFAAAAKTGTMMGLSSGLFSGTAAGIVTGIETGDFKEALKAGALAGSEGYKWGAITGALSGGASEALALKGATLKGLTMNEAATIQKESKYPLDVIKNFSSMEQYEICRDAGLTPQMINGKTALIREIDLEYFDINRRMTNAQLMASGEAAIDPISGLPYELHHVGQEMDSTLAILTKAEHMQGGNNKIWHLFKGESQIDRQAFAPQRKNFWETLFELLQLSDDFIFVLQ